MPRCPDPRSPDLTLGLAQDTLADGAKLLGRVGEEPVLLVRIGSEFAAVRAHCTPRHAPLVAGLVVGRTIRCPWHHACFDLSTGEALRAPAFDPLSCWVVELRNDRVFVSSKRSRRGRRPASPSAMRPSELLLSEGALLALQLLRRCGVQSLQAVS
jgi:nitrite reductase/ring-hydroxylating ferredoxin subunit